MATRLFPPFYQFEDADGIPLVGGTLEFYAAGTLTPKDTYADAGLTIPNGTITLNDLGRSPVDIFAGSSGDYKVYLKDAAGVLIGEADPFSADAAAPIAGGSGFRNLLINGDFSINQRVATSVADDTYCLDGWYVLTETGNVTVAQQALQAFGIPTNIRLTQPDVTAKRMGLAQIVENANCRHLKNSAAVFAGRVRHSVAAPIRYAILAWTGTADAVTSDVVLDWADASFSAGAFFLAASVTVQAVGVLNPTPGTWTDIPAISSTLSSSMNNLIVFVWTENVTAQNATLDFARMQVEPGTEASEFETLPRDVQLMHCFRNYQKSFSLGTAPAQSVEPVTAESFMQVVAASTAFAGYTVHLRVPMRTNTYTLTTYNPSAANAEIRNSPVGADCSSTTAGQAGVDKFVVSATSPAGTAVGQRLLFHWTADNSL